MPSILIVEDDTVLSGALKTKFSVEAFTVSTAGDGEEGLSSALKDHPDIILLDVMMPKMDGMTMLSHLREDAWGKNVPVIILSNNDPNNSTQLNVLDKTMPSYYLIKSNTAIDDIVVKVNELLNKGV